MIKRLYKWQLYLIAFVIFIFGLIVGSTISLFFYMKNLDIFEIRKRQEELSQEVKELRKEREQIMYIFKERGLIEDWNKQAIIIEPEEEEK